MRLLRRCSVHAEAGWARPGQTCYSRQNLPGLMQSSLPGARRRGCPSVARPVKSLNFFYLPGNIVRRGG